MSSDGDEDYEVVAPVQPVIGNQLSGWVREVLLDLCRAMQMAETRIPDRHAVNDATFTEQMAPHSEPPHPSGRDPLPVIAYFRNAQLQEQARRGPRVQAIIAEARAYPDLVRQWRAAGHQQQAPAVPMLVQRRGGVGWDPPPEGTQAWDPGLSQSSSQVAPQPMAAGPVQLTPPSAAQSSLQVAPQPIDRKSVV